MDAVRAVMDAVGSESAVLWSGGTSTGIGVLFAATYPERRSGLVLFDPQIKGIRSADYPWAQTEDEWRRQLANVERVLATILFTDIVGSTELAARFGDSAWRAILERHHAIVRGELARFHGRELDTAGDGFFASFDGRAPAVQAASSIRDALLPLELQIRSGLHTGECEVSDGKIAGIAVSMWRAHRVTCSPRRGARLEHRQGPRRRLRSQLRGSRRSSTQGRSGRVAPFRPLARSTSLTVPAPG
jgi:hypothetical protein